MGIVDRVSGVKTRWLPLRGPLKGIEVLVKFAPPEVSERFGRRLVQRGIMRETKNGREMAAGRDSDYLVEFAKEYVIDWRAAEGAPPGTIEGEDVKYSPEKMAAVLGALRSAYEDVNAAIVEEEAFFDPSSNGQK